jgi:hypothetical protein
MLIDCSIDPTAEQVRALRDVPDDRPITMVNLPKFRPEARYDDGDEAPCSGREAYARYKKSFAKTVGAVSQAQVLLHGAVQQVFVGVAGQPESDWDEVLVVRYPPRQHFPAMMADSADREALRPRYAGLERTVLLQCSAS